MNKLKILILLPGILLLPACRNRVPEEGNVNAVIIDYKVNYLDDKAGSIPTSVLPGKMIVVFAGQYALTRIEGFLGQFSLSYVANLTNSAVITMVKIFDKKMVYYGSPGELPLCIEPVQSIQIAEQDNDVKFAGFNCKKLLVTSANYDTFQIITTNEIKVKNPNAATSYKDIQEVLLLFNTQLSLLAMQLSAVKYEEKEIPWKLLGVPNDYKTVSRIEMERVIEALFK